jgi:hypothetical protein|tara:strand:+ start:258 stop:470 length:213 start_codon:yes stop_codon:yes gene_type:complete
MVIIKAINDIVSGISAIVSDLMAGTQDLSGVYKDACRSIRLESKMNNRKEMDTLLKAANIKAEDLDKYLA